MTATISISNSGQTVTPNGPVAPDVPTTTLHKITQVYFAKKVVTGDGTIVNFRRIDSLNNRRATTTFDAVLGMTVYLVIETVNMRGLSVDAQLKPATTTMTGSTDAITIQKFDPAATAGERFQAVSTITMEVGNFGALNNRDLPIVPYANLSDHRDKAIAKIQLRPTARATFNTWATGIGTTFANITIEVDRNDKAAWAKGATATEDTIGSKVYLDSDANGRFAIANRILYCIYARASTVVNNVTTYSDAPYNFLEMNGVNRRRISKIENDSATKAIYYFYDKYDNEVFIADCNKTSVTGRSNGVQLGAVPRGFTNTTDAPNGGAAETNHHYNDNSIITTGSHRNGPTDRRFPNQLRIVRYNATQNQVPLVRMPDTLNITIQGGVIAYGFSNTQRRFCNPECFAGFVGVLSQYRLAGVNSTGMCFGDATSYPSLSHPNGDSVDTSYLTDRTRQQNLLDAFVNWNFTEVIAGTNRQTWLQRAHSYAADHNDHLHSGDFSIASVQTLNQ